MSCTVKADFQGEMRRFVLPKDTTMEDFVTKMRNLFPGLGEDFNVYYRDNEGDVVRIGTMKELHDACEMSDDVLRLNVHSQKTEPSAVQTMEPRSQLDWDLSRFFADPFGMFEHDPFLHQFDFGFRFPWEHRQLKLKQKEEQLKHQREYEKKMKEVYKERQKRREKFIREEAERFRQEMDKCMAEEEKGLMKKGRKGTVVVARPKVFSKTFGSWEPVSELDPGWSSTTWGPVGYELHYYPGEAEEDKKGETKEETKEEAKEEMETK